MGISRRASQRTGAWIAVSLTACVLSVLLAPAAQGASAAPSLSVLSIAQPSNFNPTPIATVEQLRVTAGGGSFTLTVSAHTTAALPFDATAAEVQSALEALSSVGEGNVTVSGGPGGVEGVAPYTITFGGTLAGSNVALTATATALTGVTKTAEVTSVVKGGPPQGSYLLRVLNSGSVATTTPIRVTDTIPTGLTATAASGTGWSCTVVGGGASVSCTTTKSIPPATGYLTEITHTGPVLLLGSIMVSVTVSSTATGSLLNNVTVSGGGSAPASTTSSTPVSATPAPYGLEEPFLAGVTDLGGEIDHQAGDHPFAGTASFSFATQGNPTIPGGEHGAVEPVDAIKDVVVELPPGLSGNVLGIPQCPVADLSAGEPECPADTEIGWLSLDLAGKGEGIPIYNMQPEYGYPAEFGFDTLGFLHYPITVYPQVVNSAGGYHLRIFTFDLPRTVEAMGATVTLWGHPGAISGAGGDTPFLRNPTDCSAGPLATTIHVDTWEDPAPVPLSSDGAPDYENTNFDSAEWHTIEFPGPAITGCSLLSSEPGFNPSLSFQPEATQAAEPTGYNVDLHIPHEETFGTPSTPDLKDATVSLPEGVTVNPAAAGGLAACSEEQVGLANNEAPECPEASKIASAEFDVPVLPHPLTGAVYLAKQIENPFKSLLAVYLVVNDPETGIIVKVPGEVKTDPSTGRVTASFDGDPQFPVDDVKLVLHGGARAAFANPETCGIFTTTSELTPWSAPESGPPATPSSSFDVNQAAGSGSCPGSKSARPFAPGFSAGTSTPTAGAFSPLSVRVTREDGSQELGSLSVTLPPGLLGQLSGIPECSPGEIQAAEARSHPGEGALEQSQPSCPSGSEVGTVTAGVGVGSSPFYVQGRVYLAGPEGSAPFSLVIVTPAVAGPFDLGVVVVRAGIYINPYTAQVTVKSNTLPRILDGIPLDIKTIDVTTGHEHFTLNPTSCTPGTVSGTITSSEGANVAVSSPFDVGGCQNLKFTPSFAVSTSAKTSKADGASLTANVSYPAGSQGTQSDIAKVKVELPKQLPSRLTTLQKACTDAQFEANPAGCPAESKIGRATVDTPVLPVPLTGPAIFVSHGGEAFPSLTLVLQGDNVTIDLVGTTYISKAGVTSTTFKTVPDAPFSTFTLTLPEGKYSALTANGNLCAQKLTMPTEFVAQNGAEIHETTPITTEGCSTSLSFTHKIKKKTLTLHIYAPAAGKITATGKGLMTKTKTAKGQETLTITLKQKKAGKLKTTIKVTFTPSIGKDRKKQVKSAKLTFKK